jgi:hypothetical protein
VVFAVNVEAVATPLEFVAAVVVCVPFAKVPDAPEPGAVNVTETFDNGLPPESFTVTDNAVPNAALTVADWGVVPALATTELGAALTVTGALVPLAVQEPRAAVTV